MNFKSNCNLIDRITNWSPVGWFSIKTYIFTVDVNFHKFLVSMQCRSCFVLSKFLHSHVNHDVESMIAQKLIHTLAWKPFDTRSLSLDVCKNLIDYMHKFERNSEWEWEGASADIRAICHMFSAAIWFTIKWIMICSMKCDRRAHFSTDKLQWIGDCHILVAKNKCVMYRSSKSTYFCRRTQKQDIIYTHPLRSRNKKKPDLEFTLASYQSQQ